MVKILKNKFALAAAVVVLSAATLGATYAWWTSSQTDTSQVSLGALKVTAAFEADPVGSDWLYEPGSIYGKYGTLENTGSVWALASISGSAQIRFSGSSNWADAADDIVGLNFLTDPETGIGLDDEGGIEWAVFRLKDDPGQKYILLAPGESLPVSLEAEFLGAMGNEYMNSQVKVNGSVDATQTYDGALTEQWDITFEDLEMTDNTNAMARSVSVSPAVLEQLREIFHQK